MKFPDEMSDYRSDEFHFRLIEKNVIRDRYIAGFLGIPTI